MSNVTHLMVLPGNQSGGTAEEKNRLEEALFDEFDESRETLGDGSFDLWGSARAPGASVCLRSSVLDWEMFSRWVAGLPWIDRSVVRVMVCGQEDAFWHFFVLGDASLIEVDIPTRRSR